MNLYGCKLCWIRFGSNIFSLEEYTVLILQFVFLDKVRVLDRFDLSLFQSVLWGGRLPLCFICKVTYTYVQIQLLCLGTNTATVIFLKADS